MMRPDLPSDGPNADAKSNASSEEAVLLARFAELRVEMSRNIPPFSKVLAGRDTPRRGRSAPRAFGLRPLGMAAAIVLVAVLVVRRSPTSRDATHAHGTAEYALATGSLRTPTDYFLDLAARPRSDSIPRIGDVDWYPLTSAHTSLQPLSPSNPSH